MERGAERRVASFYCSWYEGYLLQRSACSTIRVTAFKRLV